MYTAKVPSTKVLGYFQSSASRTENQKLFLTENSMSRSRSAPASERPATLPGRLRTEFLSDGAYLFQDELSGGILDATAHYLRRVASGNL